MKQKALLPKDSALRQCGTRLVFTACALTVFRVGSFLPLPGVDPCLLQDAPRCGKRTVFDVLNVFFGRTVGRASVFSLGVVPYVSASVLVQLLAFVVPALKEAKADGALGRRMLSCVVRYAALLLGIVHSVGVIAGLSRSPRAPSDVPSTALLHWVSAMDVVCGAMCAAWLGDQITKKGIGNGTSALVFAGTVAELWPSVKRLSRFLRSRAARVGCVVSIGGLLFATVLLIAFVECAQRRIVVSYAQRRRTNARAAVVRDHLPIRVNTVGSTPSVFASGVMLGFASVMSWWGTRMGSVRLSEWAWCLSPGRTVYGALHSVVLVFLCFLCAGIVYDASEIADNLKSSGAFVPGIRPGRQTAAYLRRVVARLTCLGTVYVGSVCLIPEVARLLLRVPLRFHGTSVLVVVVVVIDAINEIQTVCTTGQCCSVVRGV